MFHPESRNCEPLGASMPEFTPYGVLMLVPPSGQDGPQEGRIGPPSGQACAPTRTGNYPHRVRSVLNPAAKRITYIWRILESLESWNLPPLTRRAWFDILVFMVAIAQAATVIPANPMAPSHLARCSVLTGPADCGRRAEHRAVRQRVSHNGDSLPARCVRSAAPPLPRWSAT